MISTSTAAAISILALFVGVILGVAIVALLGANGDDPS